MSTKNICYSEIGKRKTAVAKAFIKAGHGQITINNKNFLSFCTGTKNEAIQIKRPLFILGLSNEYDIHVCVRGGGITSQIGAIRLAIARTLCSINSSYRILLNRSLLLRRDSRIKERRKYGLTKARKAPQYHKR